MKHNRSRRPGARWTLTTSLSATAALAVLAGCSRSEETRAGVEPASARPETAYVARFKPLNTGVTGTQPAGEATFSIAGDRLTIAIDASGLPPGVTHWQHFHGFKDGRDAACPTNAADVNGDGIVDLIETEPASGTTMVPFNDDPVAMDVPKDTYPRASATGAMRYEKTVSLSALEAAFGSAFDGQDLELDSRVVFLHGVPSETELASSVASLGPIPAQVTIPIACAEIEPTR